MPLLAGVDIGTSGAKVGLFDEAGRLLGLGRAGYGVVSPRQGWVECDPERWWEGFLTALRAACDAARVRADEIAALGLSVLFPAVIPLDARGRPLYPAILYSDRRSIAQAQEIERRVPRAEYERRIGNRLTPGTCAVTSMRWLCDERPEVYRAARALGFANTFFGARLTGEFCADPTHAALSGLAEICDPWRWSESLCERLGVAPELLPRIVGPAEAIGAVTPAAARATGLRAGVPVAAGSGDVPASAIGAGARGDGTAVYIAGSTDCVALPLTQPAADAAWVNCAFVERGAWLGIGTTTSSGASVEWFTREFLGEQDVARMTNLAESASPGGGGLLYLPYLQGERTPVWDARARGVFIGLTAATTRADLARVVLEGVAFALRQVIECAPTPVRALRAVGGGTRNALWNQIKADVLNLPLKVLEFQETGALGAALMGGAAAGALRSLEERAKAAGEGHTVEPDPARAALYDELYRRYAEIYPRTRELMHRLNQLSG